MKDQEKETAEQYMNRTHVSLTSDLRRAGISNEIFAVMDQFASSRLPVPTSRQSDGYIDKEDNFFSAKEVNQSKWLQSQLVGFKPVYFSPLPVAEQPKEEMTEEQAKNICTAIEVYIQSNDFYKRCIGNGNFSIRFAEVYQKLLSLLPVPNTKTVKPSPTSEEKETEGRGDEI